MRRREVIKHLTGLALAGIAGHRFGTAKTQAEDRISLASFTARFQFRELSVGHEPLPGLKQAVTMTFEISIRGT